MYFKITKTLLNKFSVLELHTLFLDVPLFGHSKSYIVDTILEDMTSPINNLDWQGWLSVCSFCRFVDIHSAPVKQPNPIYCTNCGRVSPFTTLQRNQADIEDLLRLAFQLKGKNNSSTRRSVLSQALISTITGFEVFLRQCYSFYFDFEHVLIGKPLHETIYPDTRNHFLNLGNARRKILSISSIDLKELVNEEKYKMLQLAFPKRHAIVHNAGIKDKEYISQTGETEENLREPIAVTITDIRQYKTAIRLIAKVIEKNIREKLIEYLHRRMQYSFDG